MVDIKTSDFASYSEFWPFYLSQHSNRTARLLHVIGTLLALLALAKAIICFSLLWLVSALIIGYGFAWIAHRYVEHNHPATFTHPLWSLRGDLHMLLLWLRGHLETELLKHKI